MTTRYTDAEWANIFAEVEKGVIVDSSKRYPIPQVGSIEFTQTVDHTLLKLESKSSQIDELCAEARRDQFATVCVRPNWVSQCLSNLKGSSIGIASVIGFHEGTYSLSHKLQESNLSLTSGATELDVVINWPSLQAKEYASIYNELAALRTAAPHPTTLKLIFETSQLSSSQILAAATLAAAAGFDYIKTSSGFHGHGATVEHVRLMKSAAEYLARNPRLYGGREGTREMKVKASGGVRTLEDAVRMLEAGASRLGTSGGVWIAKEAREKVGVGAVGDREGVNGERPGMQTRLFTDY